MEGCLMTRDETKMLLSRMEASFPSWNSQVPIDIRVDTWHEYLQKCEYSQALAAMRSYIISDTSGFPPTIGKFIEVMQNLYGKRSLSESDAWGMVLKALSNSISNYREEFYKLPVDVQRAVGNPMQLRQWAMIEDFSGNSMKYIESSFKKSFSKEHRAVRESMIAGIPAKKEMPKISNNEDKETKEYAEKNTEISETIAKKIEETKRKLKRV